MRPELETYQLIDHFLNGILEGDALQAFEKRMLEDASFADEVALQKITNAVVIGATYDDLRTQMTQDIHKIDASTGGNWLGGLLGGILLSTVIIGAYLYNQEHTEKRVTTNESTPTASIEKKTVDRTSIQETKRAITPLNIPDNSTIAIDNTITNHTIVNTVVDTHQMISIPQQQIPAENTTIVNTPITEQHQEVISPCTNNAIHAIITTEASCENSSTGSIIIASEKITGGTKPYKTTLSKTEKPELKEHYNYLQSGDYTVYITDKNNCSASFSTTVESKSCIKKTYVFAPNKGETWKIEGATDLEYKLTIINVTGAQVYKTPVMQGEFEWNGMDQHGSLLDAGLYIYVLEYTNGTKDNGQVTIIR